MSKGVLLGLVMTIVATPVLHARAESELDAQMSEVAAFFAGKVRGEHDVLFATALDRSKLDLSIESLKAVDEWLGVLAKNDVDPSSREAAETLVWTGAYVGEVIRACSGQKFTWKRYEDYMPDQPETIRKLIPYTFGTQFLLVTGEKRVTMPLNRVGRFLAEGPEHELHVYVQGECSR